MKDIKAQIIEAGLQAVNQLIKVAKEEIIKPQKDDELAADRLKNAAATKKLCIMDAFEILRKIEEEKANLEEGNSVSKKLESKQGFAERNSK